MNINELRDALKDKTGIAVGRDPDGLGFNLLYVDRSGSGASATEEDLFQKARNLDFILTTLNHISHLELENFVRECHAALCAHGLIIVYCDTSQSLSSP